MVAGSGGSSSSGSDAVQRELDRLNKEKASKEATDVRLKGIEDEVDETKKIALAAKKEAATPHECHQEKRMETIEESTGGWDRLFKGMVITVISAVVVVGSLMALLYYTKADVSDVDNVRIDVVKIRNDVDSVQASQQRVESTVNEMQKKQDQMEKDRMEQIKKAMHEVVVEANLSVRSR